MTVFLKFSTKTIKDNITVTSMEYYVGVWPLNYLGDIQISQQHHTKHQCSTARKFLHLIRKL